MDKTKKIALTGIFIAMNICIYLLFPLNNRTIQSYIGIVTPIPAAIISKSIEFKYKVMYLFILILGCFLTIDFMVVVSFVLPNAILGLILGELKKDNILICVVIISIINGFSNIYELVIYSIVSGIKIFELYNRIDAALVENLDLFGITFTDASSISAIIYILCLFSGAIGKSLVTFYIYIKSLILLGKYNGRDLRI